MLLKMSHFLPYKNRVTFWGGNKIVITTLPQKPHVDYMYVVCLTIDQYKLFSRKLWYKVYFFLKTFEVRLCGFNGARSKFTDIVYLLYIFLCLVETRLNC